MGFSSSISLIVDSIVRMPYKNYICNFKRTEIKTFSVIDINNAVDPWNPLNRDYSHIIIYGHDMAEHYITSCTC